MCDHSGGRKWDLRQYDASWDTGGNTAPEHQFCKQTIITWRHIRSHHCRADITARLCDDARNRSDLSRILVVTTRLTQLHPTADPSAFVIVIRRQSFIVAVVNSYPFWAVFVKDYPRIFYLACRLYRTDNTLCRFVIDFSDSHLISFLTNNPFSPFSLLCMKNILCLSGRRKQFWSESTLKSFVLPYSPIEITNRSTKT